MVPDSKPRWAANWLTNPSARGSLKRHAQFQNRHARPVKGQGQFAGGGEMGITGANVNNQPFFAGAFERGEFFATMRFMCAKVSRFNSEVTSGKFWATTSQHVKEVKGVLCWNAPDDSTGPMKLVRFNRGQLLTNFAHDVQFYPGPARRRPYTNAPR